jgi:hypothetical protein
MAAVKIVVDLPECSAVLISHHLSGSGMKITRLGYGQKGLVK